MRIWHDDENIRKACKACAEETKGSKCHECEHAQPELTEKNQLVEWLIDVLQGNIHDIKAIQSVFDLYGIPKQDRIWLFESIQIFIDEYGKQNPNRDQGRR